MHEIVMPTTHINKHLGWEVDTQEMWVGIPKPRSVFIGAMLEKWQTRSSCTLKELKSISGLFQFLASNLFWLNSTVGYIVHLHVEWSKSSHPGPFTLPLRLKYALKWISYLIKAWDGRCEIFDSLAQEYDCELICDAGYSNEDAGACMGRGAICDKTKLFHSAEWSAEEVSHGHSAGSPFFELCNYVETAVGWALLGYKKIKITGDCKPAIQALWKRYSPNAKILALIRYLDFVALHISFSVTFVHRERDHVQRADDLARGVIQVPETYSRRIPWPIPVLDLSKTPNEFLKLLAIPLRTRQV